MAEHRRPGPGAGGVLPPLPVRLLRARGYNKSTSDQEFLGGFATGPLHLLPVNLDLYWLDASNRIAAFNGTIGRERRLTLGEQILSAAGSHMKLADTPERLADVHPLPPQRLVPQRRDDRVYYVYADPTPAPASEPRRSTRSISGWRSGSASPMRS